MKDTDADVQAETASDSRSAAWAYSQPEAQANKAARMKITMRERAVSTPIASAITMPPLSARIALPSRESSRLLVVTASEHEQPDQVGHLLALAQLVAEQRDRRDAGEAGVAARKAMVPEQEWAQAPGDGRQRQVMPGQAQGSLPIRKATTMVSTSPDEQGEPGQTPPASQPGFRRR